MDVFDFPLIITVGFNGSAVLAAADYPALILDFSGIVTMYT